MCGRAILIFAAGAVVASAASDWDVLKVVTHRTTYGFVLRDGTCTTGRIGSVTADSIKISEPKPLTLKRSDVLRVSDGQHAYDVVYTARSSWSDVAAVPPKETEYLRVLTTDGKRYEGEAAHVTDAGIALNKRGKMFMIEKSDIARVYYVRLKPLSDSARYSDEEHFPLNPELWPYFMNIGVHMDVLLYDASLPEDNSTVACRASGI